jgi:hypothetical protein
MTPQINTRMLGMILALAVAGEALVVCQGAEIPESAKTASPEPALPGLIRHAQGPKPGLASGPRAAAQPQAPVAHVSIAEGGAVAPRSGFVAAQGIKAPQIAASPKTNLGRPTVAATRSNSVINGTTLKTPLLRADPKK